MSDQVKRGANIGAFIRDQREQAQVSVRQLARLTGVSNPYLSQIERGLRRPSAEILQQIAKGLRISAEQLYVQAGILEERVENDATADLAGSPVLAAIRADPHLLQRQKQVLVDVYHALRQDSGTSTTDAIADVAQIATDAAPPAHPTEKE